MGSKKGDLNRLFNALRLQGCEIKRGGKHYQVRAPGGKIVTISGTPGEYRGFQNMLSLLRRAGLNVEGF